MNYASISLSTHTHTHTHTESVRKMKKKKKKRKKRGRKVQQKNAIIDEAPLVEEGKGAPGL